MRQIQIEECLERLLRHIVPVTRTETVSLENADGRILVADEFAGRNVPDFPRSAMDGYALRSADTVKASKDVPAWLAVVGTLFAGDVLGQDVDWGPGTAVRIMTGACVSAAYDAVARQEDTDYGSDRVAVYAPVSP